MSSETSDPLRLAIVTMEFPATSETFVSGRVKTLADLGVNVSVYALRPEGEQNQQMAVARGVEGVKRDSNSLGSSLRGMLTLLAKPRLTIAYLKWLVGATSDRPDTLLRSLVLTPRAFAVWRQLADDQPDFVHAEWGHYPSLVLWLVQQSLPKVSTSMALNAYDLTMEFGGSRLVAQRVDLIRTHTSANIPHIARFAAVPEESIELVYNGVDVGRVDAAVAVTEKVPGRVVAIARMIPEKRLDLVVRAFMAATKGRPDAELRIFGDGPERERLEALISQLGLGDRVKIYGHVDHNQVLRELAQAEAMMLLSETRDERLPNVVKEGMAARCVCISSRSVGIEELVEHGRTGFIVDYGDVDAAAEALLWALEERAAAGQMGTAARRFVGENFDHQANVERFLELWLTRRKRQTTRA